MRIIYRVDNMHLLHNNKQKVRKEMMLIDQIRVALNV